jgi:hypothetical protein
VIYRFAGRRPDHRRARALAENAELRDGQHDFDCEIGTWKTQLRRLVNPLTGSTTWEVNWIAIDTRVPEGSGAAR